jgi:hypothetical protein
MKRRDFLRSDFSMFMGLVFMLAGALLAILISNLAIVIVDPATVVISGVIRAPGMEQGSSGNQQLLGKIHAGGNVDKLPHFVDVYRDRLVFYPGERRLPTDDLAKKDNYFENFLADISHRARSEYVVLLVRPGTAALSRKLRTSVIEHGIDVGLEIYEADQRANYERALHERKPGDA